MHRTFTGVPKTVFESLTQNFVSREKLAVSLLFTKPAKHYGGNRYIDLIGTVGTLLLYG